MNFWIFKMWWRHNKLFLHPHTVQCLHSYDTKQQKQKHHHFICQICFRWLNVQHWCITIITRGSLSSYASNVCQTAFGTILHHDLQFLSGIRNFSLWHKSDCRQWWLWPTCDCCYQTKRGQSEVSDQRRTTKEGKLPKRQFWSFTGKLELDPLSSHGCMQVLAHWMPSSWLRNRGGVGWSGAFTCFENLTEAGHSGCGTSLNVMRLLYTSVAVFVCV